MSAARNRAAVWFRRDPRTVVMTISLLVSVVMLTGKLIAYAVSRSYAILADAAESVIHGVATGLAFFSLWYSSKPADREHPYGHGRVAYLSAGFEGGLVFGAACAILIAAIRGLIVGPDFGDLGMGMAITAGLAAINLVLGVSLVVTGRRHHSIIVEANGLHVLSDMWTSLAALGGLGVVLLSGLWWLDPVVALAIGGFVGWTGARLLRRSVAGLMDEVPQATSAQILAELAAAVEAGRIEAFHQVRCRRVNDQLWIDLHLLVPGDESVHAAHERVTAVEQAIRGRFGGRPVHITSHIEPAEHERAHPGGHRVADPLGEPSARQY